MPTHLTDEELAKRLHDNWNYVPSGRGKIIVTGFGELLLLVLCMGEILKYGGRGHFNHLRCTKFVKFVKLLLVYTDFRHST